MLARFYNGKNLAEGSKPNPNPIYFTNLTITTVWYSMY